MGGYKTKRKNILIFGLNILNILIKRNISFILFEMPNICIDHINNMQT